MACYVARSGLRRNLAARGQAPRPTPDFSKTRAEAVQLLQSLIRIDTSNPPGNETKVVDYIIQETESSVA